ncbi:MAG: CRISPR-associated protein [Bacteroidetes bacterium]|nr:CRISPR-associated protein [Bacteroidota bacterium]
MLINLSNHPFTTWSQRQVEAATQLYGAVVDLPFPVVSPESDEPAVQALAHTYYDQCKQILSTVPTERNAVHVMGELTFTVALVSLLLRANIECVASTTDRIVEERNGVKFSQFQFVRFRRYTLA